MNREDFFRIARQTIRLNPDSGLAPEAVDATGNVVNVLVAGVSAMVEENEARSEGRFAARLVATARDADLDALILELTKGRLPRKGASAAVMYGYLTRGPGSLLAGGTVDAGTEVLAGGLTWTLDTAASIAAGAPYAATPAYLTCTTLGLGGNAIGPDQWTFKQPPAWDPGLRFESIEGPSEGGAERETDADYRARYALWDAGLDRNVDWLAAGVLSLPGVAYAVAIEDIDAEGLPVGTVTIYLADANGRATGALLRRVRIGLRSLRLLGQRVNLAGTAPAWQTISLRFGVLTGFVVTEVVDQARAAVVAYVNRLAPGATLDPAAIGVVLKGVLGLDLLPSLPNGVVSPAVPVVPAAASTTLRTSLDLVSVLP